MSYVTYDDPPRAFKYSVDWSNQTPNQQELCGRAERLEYQVALFEAIVANNTTNAGIADSLGDLAGCIPFSLSAPFFVTADATGANHLQQVSITAGGSAQTFGAFPYFAEVGGVLSIGLGSDQEFVTVTAAAFPDESAVPPFFGTFTAVFTMNHAAPVGITPAILYGSTPAVDDMWKYASFAAMGTMSLGDNLRLVAQKYTRLLPFYQAEATDYRARATAGGGCP